VEQVKALGFKEGLGLWCAPFWVPALPSFIKQLGHCCLQDASGKPIVNKEEAWSFSTPELKTGFLRSVDKDPRCVWIPSVRL